MKKAITMLGLAGMLCAGVSGCVSTSGTMICFRPIDPARYSSSQQLLDELNASLPFAVAPQDFTCRQTDGMVIAWVAMEDPSRSTETIRAIENSTAFRSLSVGYFDREDRLLFALGPQHWEF